MNKYLIAVLVVAVLAFTGCNKEEKLLADCYANSEQIVKALVLIAKVIPSVDYADGARGVLGVSVDGYITQAGRDRCKRMIELGEFPNSP
jgi:hypothetical protein